MVKETSIKLEKSLKEHFNSFFESLFIYGTLFIILTINFCALSISLHRNKNSPFGKRIGGAIFAFLFGLIYLIINYYINVIIQKQKALPMNNKKLFPFI